MHPLPEHTSRILGDVTIGSRWFLSVSLPVDLMSVSYSPLSSSLAR